MMIKRVFGFSGFRVFGLSGFRVFGLSGFQVRRFSGFRAFGFLLLCGLCQCQTESAKPANLLSPADMTKALIEVHTLEARIQEHTYNLLDSAQVAYQDAEKKLFQKLKITYKQYKNSYDYYMKEQPEALDNIYVVVIDSLRKREAKAPSVEAKKDTSLKNKPNPKLISQKDSIMGRLRGARRRGDKADIKIETKDLRGRKLE
jgi:hypothetical protein